MAHWKTLGKRSFLVTPFPAVMMQALVFALVFALGAATGLAQGKGSIEGKVQGALPGQTLEGATVVLLKFTMGADGKPAGGPVAREKTGKDGSFRFRNVEITPRSVFQVGTRVNGRLAGSGPFSFPVGKTSLTINLEIPKVVEGFEGLVVDQALLFLGPGRGEVEVTEVLHVRNPAASVLDGTETPLLLEVPQEAEKLELLRPPPDKVKHERLGTNLRLFTQIEPGQTTLAFRYRLPAALGSKTLDKKYPVPLIEVRVMAPEGLLKVSGDSLEPKSSETMQEVAYDMWKGGGQPAGRGFSIHLSGMAPRQEVFALPVVGFFVLMGGVVWWFLRRRLATARK